MMEATKYMIKRCKYRKFHNTEKVYCNYSDYCTDYFTNECKIKGLIQPFDLCMNEAIEELNKKQKEVAEQIVKGFKEGVENIFNNKKGGD